MKKKKLKPYWKKKKQSTATLSDLFESAVVDRVADPIVVASPPMFLIDEGTTIYHPGGSRSCKRVSQEKRLKKVEQIFGSPYAHLLRADISEVEAQMVKAYEALYQKAIRFVAAAGPVRYEDAEDITQSLWVELLVGIRSRHIKYWSDGIVSHVAQHRMLDHIRTQRTHERVARQIRNQDAVERNVDDEIWMAQAMAALTDDERAVITRRYQLGFTIERTANELDISPSTVKRLAAEALVCLRQYAIPGPQSPQDRSQAVEHFRLPATGNVQQGGSGPTFVK